MTPAPRYRRMPAVIDWWFRRIRGTAETWMNTPIGILVPPALWDSGAWKGGRYLWIRDHEETHWPRMMARPVLSRWWWCLHYLLSTKMAYEEEILACRRELLHFAPGYERNNHAAWLVNALIADYGFGWQPRETILRDLTAFL